MEEKENKKSSTKNDDAKKVTKKTTASNSKKTTVAKVKEEKVAPVENKANILHQRLDTPQGLSKAAKASIAAAVTTVVAAGAVVGGVLLADNSNKIVYSVNGVEEEIELGKDKKLSDIQKPTIDGYDFEGWYRDSKLTDKLDDDSIFTEDTTIYPKFVPKNYQVEYYANNGTGEVAFQEVTFKNDYRLVANTFTRENYVFVGWSENPNAHYDDEDVFKVDKKFTLLTEGFKYYAIWKGENRKITFDTSELRVNGEEYTFTKTNCPYGEKFILPAIDGEITNTNDEAKKFAGYMVKGEVFSVGDEILITEDTTITIVWEERDSILYFNLNLPTGETTEALEPLSFTTPQEKYTYLHLPTPGELTNYEFVCWNTKIDGTGEDYSVSDSFETTEQSNVLYAIWAGKTRTINVYDKGELVSTINTRFGETVELPEFTLENYNFIGLNDKPDFTGNIYKGSITVEFAETLTELYAEYERKQITVSFDANGGTGTYAPILVNTNEKYTFKASEIEAQKEAITRQYYTLAGWSTNKNALTSEAKFNVDIQEANVVLYAIWQRKSATVSFSSTDFVIPGEWFFNQGEMYTFTDTVLEREGYVVEKFIYKGEEYSLGDSILLEEEFVSIEVVWKEAKLVSFDIEGVESVRLTTGEKVAIADLKEGDTFLAPNAPVAKNYYDEGGTRYYFAGWSTAKGATMPNVYIGETEITLNENPQSFYSVYLSASEELKYELDSDVYTVSYDSSKTPTYEGFLVVPNTYNGIDVKKIGDFRMTNTDRVILAEGIAEMQGVEIFDEDAWEYYHYMFYQSSFKNITIPSSMKTIGASAFSGCTNLASITISEGVTNIVGNAFQGCTSLTNIIIPEGVTSIGGLAFYKCTNLVSVTIPEGVISIGNGAFRNCRSLISITIPSGVTSIGNSVFLNCTNLVSVTIPSSVTSIGDSAFSNCTNLVSVTIPEDVISIGSYAFYSCTNLASVTIPEGVTSIGESAFQDCTSLANVAISSSVESIGWYAFQNCTSLTSVTISEGVITIGYNAFSGCTGLTSITIPSTITDMGSAFEGCTGLTSVTISEGVTSISQFAFQGCTSLASITIPSSVTSISKSAFQNCEALTNVTIPSNVQYIGYYAFSGCTGLTGVTISEGVKNIDPNAFEGCTNLASITIPSSIESINFGVFLGCTGLTSVTIQKGTTSIGDRAFSECTNLVSVTIPEGVISIGSYAFYNCTNLSNVTIPEGVTSIGEYAFRGCISLTSVTIPSTITNMRGVFLGCTGLASVTISEGVTSIDSLVFGGCTGLTSIIIPSSVTSIGSRAFYNCSNLKEMIFKGATPPSIDSEAIPTSVTQVYVPATAVDAYKTKLGSSFTNKIFPIPSEEE